MSGRESRPLAPDGAPITSYRGHPAAVRDTYVGAAHVQLIRGSEVVKALSQTLRGETGVDYCASCDQHPDATMYEKYRREYPDEKPSKW